MEHLLPSLLTRYKLIILSVQTIIEQTSVLCKLHKMSSVAYNDLIGPAIGHQDACGCPQLVVRSSCIGFAAAAASAAATAADNQACVAHADRRSP